MSRLLCLILLICGLVVTGCNKKESSQEQEEIEGVDEHFSPCPGC